MNKVILIGRLTKDVDLRQNGEMSIGRFTIAVDRKLKKDGESTADFINCVAFKSHAENISKYFSKGNRISIAGHIQTGSYTNKDGKKVYTTDVIVDEWEFVESKSQAQENVTKEEPKQEIDGFVDVPAGVEDELPFT